MATATSAKPLVTREYLRVSKDRTRKGKSPDQQHAENLDAIERQGWTPHPAPPYRDTDRSASRFATKAREAFQDLLDDLRNGAFDADVLVLWESSRGSRRLDEWATLIDLCSKRNVHIFVTTHRHLYDPGNARDRRSLGEDAVDSEYESGKTSERIQRHVRDAAKAGKPHGKNLYGYRRVYRPGPSGPELDYIEEHPDQAPIVREAAERVLAGETFYTVAKSFNARGIPPRRPSFEEHRAHLGWTPPAVKQMLTVPAYAAKRVHRGEIVADAVWPELIDFATWTKLQAVISPPERKRTNDWVATHLLTGIAVCAVCGSGLRLGKQNLGKRKDADGNPLPRPIDEHGKELPYPTYHSYVCSGTPGKTGFHVAMKKEKLDVLVTEAVLARLERPDFLAHVGTETGETDAERQALIDEIARHHAYLDTVREQAAELGRFDLVLDQEARVQPKIKAAQTKLERLAQVDPAVIDLAATGAVREAWQELDIVAQRKIVRALVVPTIKRIGRGAYQNEKLARERIEMRWR